MNAQIESLVAGLNQKISGFSYGNQPAELYEPISYIMNLGGKRIRPLLALLAYQLYKDDPESIAEAALSIEVFHNFTLMHDDIMDKAPLRRGKDTVHEKWDSNVAILSGDVMLIKAYEMLGGIPTEKLPHVIRAFNRCATAVCEGQQLDMNFEKKPVISEAEYIDMIGKKTAALIGYSVELGAMLGGAPENDQALLKEFGEAIGIGFQLKDDLLDAYADAAKFGKKVGGDIVANKKTFLLIKALELAEGELKTRLNYALSSETVEAHEKVRMVVDIYDTLHIKELTEEKLNEFFERGFDALDRLPVEDAKKEDLRSLAQQLIGREN